MNDTFEGTAVGRYADFEYFQLHVSWGYAALHPRLYAAGRFADLQIFLH
jgi:hypothetical protein